jgi:hypothetical protein
MLPKHMFCAALVGVGGVGIGLKLHDLDKENRPGPIKPELVKSALNNRDLGAATVAGKAATELARLDWDYSRGVLSKSIDQLRRDLYQRLLSWHQQVSLEDCSGEKPKGFKSDPPLVAGIEKELGQLLTRIGSEYPRRKVHSATDRLEVSRGPQAVSDEWTLFDDPLLLYSQRVIQNGEKSGDLQFSAKAIEKINQALTNWDLDQLQRLLDIGRRIVQEEE